MIGNSSTHDTSVRTISIPRGRVVGGSSAVNTCIALRGGPQDYDEWADQGLKEWSWAHCLPAFKRLEHDHDFNDEWHGQQGPLPIRRHPPEELTEWQQAFLEACADTGYAACADSNNPTQTGYGPHAMNRINGRRISAAEAWLTPDVRARPGLTIQGHTHVHRVLFDGRTATGVEVTANGERAHYRAKTGGVVRRSDSYAGYFTALGHWTQGRLGSTRCCSGLRKRGGRCAIAGPPRCCVFHVTQMGQHASTGPTHPSGVPVSKRGFDAAE